MTKAAGGPSSTLIWSPMPLGNGLRGGAADVPQMTAVSAFRSRNRPEGDDDHAEGAAVLDGADEQPLEAGAHDHRPATAMITPIQMLEALLDGEDVDDEGADRAHLALGEVQVAGGLVDDHDRQGHRRVEGAVAEPV